MQTLSRQRTQTPQEWLHHAHELSCIAIMGRTGTGKTAKEIMIADEVLKVKPVFWFAHPTPELMTERGYELMYDMSSLATLQDAALVIDEPQLWFKGKEGQNALVSLLIFARQRSITLILGTSDTRFFTAALEDYIDAVLVGDVEFSTVKKGSIVKRAIKKSTAAFIDINEFRINVNEYVFYSRKLFRYNGLKTCSLPQGWTEKHSKPFRREKEDE